MKYDKTGLTGILDHVAAKVIKATAFTLATRKFIQTHVVPVYLLPSPDSHGSH